MGMPVSVYAGGRGYKKEYSTPPVLLEFTI